MSFSKNDKEFITFKNIFITYCFGIMAVLLFIILGYLWYLGHQTPPKEFQIGDTGTIGDTIGGIMGPLIAVGAAFLTFIAFYVQYKANQQQKTDLQIERFENKFYSLLEIHRNNVNEIKIGGDSNGRDCFVSLFNELKFTYSKVEFYYKNTYHEKDPDNILDNEQLYNIAYLIFFFGLNDDTLQLIDDLLGENFNKFIHSFHGFIIKLQGMSVNNEFNKIPNAEGYLSGLTFKYPPFQGQMSSHSHYFRHLFNLVKLIEEADNEIFNYNAKYSYAATIRSQLSVSEQLLLYYNAVSVLGEPWLNLKGINIMKKYCIVRSIPLPLADFYKQPVAVLGEDNGMKNSDKKVTFEWLEIRERLGKMN